MNILSIPMRLASLFILMAGLSFGCGQRGELYLRDNPPPGVKPAKPGAQKPVPYPQPAGEPSGAESKP